MRIAKLFAWMLSAAGTTAVVTAFPAWTAGPAHAQPDSGAAEAAEAMRLPLRDSVTVSHPGATAVFSVDPSVADATISGGKVTITSRGVGTTTISVVSPGDVASLRVTVVGGSPAFLDEVRIASSRQWTQWQGNYESSTNRLTNSLELMDGGADRTLRAYAVGVTRFDTGAGELDERNSLPALALEWRNHRNEVVLFDKMVNHSPLTLENVMVRGVHARVGGAEVHAGVTSPFLYQNVFLSVRREAVLGASYELRSGRSSITPSLYSYPSEPQTGGSEGTMGSVMYRYATRDERLQLRGELGWGGELGAAGELSYNGAEQRAWLSAVHQPRGFAGLGVGRPPGTLIDGLWTAEPTSRFTINATGSISRYDVGDQHASNETASAEARVKLVPQLAASSGASVGWFRTDTMDASTRSITVPVGLHLDVPHFGASAVYRYTANTARNEGGHGGRISMRVHRGALYATGFVDAQQDAATVDLILRDEPGLAQVLTELGLTAATPEELARLLRDNAVLMQLGYVEGSTLEFNPWRAQAGGELAWLSRDESRQQLRLRLLFDRTQTVTRDRDTRSVALSFSRRLTAELDATAMLSWWSHDSNLAVANDTWSIAAGLRLRLSGAPTLPTFQRDIDGVIVDERGTGAAIAGVTVRLDGGRVAVSDAAGRFVFENVERGEHHVDAEAPASTYFTTPSRLPVAAGGTVRFGIARAAAHLGGAVVDDVGTGIAGIRFTLRRGGDRYTVTTDSNGRFRFDGAPGDYLLDPVVESVPAGYDLAAARAQQIQLEADQPAQAQVVLPANRSIAGTIHTAATAAATATVVIVELGRAGTIDAGGHYVFRGLKPGRYTVEATIAGQAMRRVVELPAQPTAISNVDFP